MAQPHEQTTATPEHTTSRSFGLQMSDLSVQCIASPMSIPGCGKRHKRGQDTREKVHEGTCVEHAAAPSPPLSHPGVASVRDLDPNRQYVCTVLLNMVRGLLSSSPCSFLDRSLPRWPLVYIMLVYARKPKHRLAALDWDRKSQASPSTASWLSPTCGRGFCWPFPSCADRQSRRLMQDTHTLKLMSSRALLSLH